MFRYMISFTYRTPDGHAFTSVEWPFKRQIRSMDDITRVSLDLRERGFIDAVILSFSLFADPAPNPQAAS
ncbi:hypothetical protein D7147_03875 [Micromonospora musae]|uniref:Uncharacterized protein n=1 Tax=Micromonospora musae TaxID=1894970 RepID=A0ABX9RJQ6_9ACTN|nr:hypothetical protein [Micromonospora musae]RKN24138.1 hypothetical protein D7147_03875 [Micromonospora musae]